MSLPAPNRILLVEDDLPLARGMVENLRAEGYEIELVQDGLTGLARARNADHDLLILDVMLPRMSGLELCATLRGEGKKTPVLFLTARGEPDDRVRGLEAGGDDYLTKPFHLEEFLLRIKAILRRWEWYRSSVATAAGPVLKFGGNEVDFRSFNAKSWDGSTHDLTEKEAMILKVLAERPGEVIAREDLIERVWGMDVYPSTRTVDNFILRLRKVFEREQQTPRHFITVRGVGYRFLPEGSEP
ncbi:MAG: response regulator transcription factor [Rhodospirillaceae bacterium]|nr:MAG: response regulator transcription factor [Rhodospirillaceae bacterium]